MNRSITLIGQLQNQLFKVCTAILLAAAGDTVFAEPSANISTTPPKPMAHPLLRLVIVGDSTVCNYTESKPERGWGQFFGEYFKESNLKVMNLAASGRSTKTFIAEGRWQKALDRKSVV